MIYEILQSVLQPSDSRWRLIFSLFISTFSALGVSPIIRYINARYLLTCLLILVGKPSGLLFKASISAVHATLCHGIPDDMIWYGMYGCLSSGSAKASSRLSQVFSRRGCEVGSLHLPCSVQRRRIKASEHPVCFPRFQCHIFQFYVVFFFYHSVSCRICSLHSLARWHKRRLNQALVSLVLRPVYSDTTQLDVEWSWVVSAKCL